MPAPVQGILSNTEAKTVDFALSPAQNAIHSLYLLTTEQDLYGLADWVVQTNRELSHAKRERNRLVVEGFYFLITPRENYSSLIEFVDKLADRDPEELQNDLLKAYAKVAGVEHLDKVQVLASAESYVNFLSQHFPPNRVDEDLERQAYSLLVNPVEMRSLIVNHLRDMWDDYLAAEWQRVEPMLRDSIEAFLKADFGGKDRLQIAQEVTGNELSGPHWEKSLLGDKQVVFVPSAHIGPYVGKVEGEKRVWIIFGARLPEGTEESIAPALGRAQIVMRLNALADDTRLQILRMLAEGGELRSQEVMEALEISQSATSRHLKQLSATGYLIERRCNGAKCYRLNPERIESTLKAVQHFLLDL